MEATEGERKESSSEYLDDDVVRYCFEEKEGVGSLKQSPRNSINKETLKRKLNKNTIFKQGLSKFESLENLMLSCERERRVLARSSQRLERRNRALEKAMTKMKESICKNIDKNKNDIYGGFVEIVPDEESKPVRVREGDGHHHPL